MEGRVELELNNNCFRALNEIRMMKYSETFNGINGN